jgi:hypothetical protein
MSLGAGAGSKRVKIMQSVAALSSEDLTKVFNPKPVGEPVNAHVQTPTPEPTVDYEEIGRFIGNPDFRKVFGPSE